jgi:putative transposase
VQRKRHSKKEINALLRHADELAAAGKLQKEIARALGVSVMTLHRWRKAAAVKHSGETGDQPRPERPHQPAEPDTAALIAELEHENAQLRVLVTDLLLEKSRLEEALRMPSAGRVRQIMSRRAAKG